MTQVEDAIRGALYEIDGRIEDECERVEVIYYGRKYKEKYEAMGRINGLREAKDLIVKLLEPYMDFEPDSMWEDYE